MEGPMFKNTNETPKKSQTQGEHQSSSWTPSLLLQETHQIRKRGEHLLKIKFPNSFLSWGAYQIKKEENTLVEHPQVCKPFPIARSKSNKETRGHLLEHHQVCKPFLITRSKSNKETRGHLLEHHQVCKPFPIVRSISNKENGRTLTSFLIGRWSLLERTNWEWKSQKCQFQKKNISCSLGVKWGLYDNLLFYLT
jgi:hypothetical protein